MSFKFQTVGVFGTHYKKIVSKTVEHVIELLDKWQLISVLETKTAKSVPNYHGASEDLEVIGQKCDLIIVVGGDGNMLRAARALASSSVPIIGINRGQLGFLTDINPEQMEKYLKDILSGNYFEQNRLLIEAQVEREGEANKWKNALNDIVLFSGSIARTIEFDVRVDGQFVYDQSSNGLILATPTGSTAFSLSADGPILPPDLDGLIMSPMYPHALTFRTLVLNANSEIVITIKKDNETHPYLSFDGSPLVYLEANDKITVRKQEQPLRLIHPCDYDYYNLLRKKMNLSLRDCKAKNW